MKSVMARLERNVTHLGERKTTYSVLVGKSEGKGHLGDISAEGRLILRWFLKKCVWGTRLDLSLRTGCSARLP
jgi:hypothetical protein